MADLDSLHAWCSLWRLPRVGARRYNNVLKAFGTPKAFFDLPERERKISGISFNLSDIDAARRGADKDIRWIQDNDNAKILTINCDEYPERLKTISDPPPVLFIRGIASLLSEPQLAIVGSRSPSHEGIDNAQSFANYLANNGIVITSGLAQGVDGAAHEGALTSGDTIAVMGTGPDRIYPAKHQHLAHQIAEQGCIITELPVGTPVVAHAFPRRNRLISGLSLGTLVIEASLKSGSLITARTALEQNREVFAIPGSIHNPLARGCNHLIRNGAKLVETAQDIFEELQAELFAFVESEKSVTLNKHDELAHKSLDASSNKQKNLFEDDPEKSSLWEALSHDPHPVDVLVQRSGLAANQVSSMLLIMELDGCVIKHPGGRFQKRT